MMMMMMQSKKRMELLRVQKMEAASSFNMLGDSLLIDIMSQPKNLEYL